MPSQIGQHIAGHQTGEWAQLSLAEWAGQTPPPKYVNNKCPLLSCMPGRLRGYETALSDKRSLTYKVTLVLSAKEGAAKKIHRKSLALRESAHGGPCVDSGRILDIKSAGHCDRSDSGRQGFKRHPGMTLCIQGRPLRRQVWNLLEGGCHLGCVEATGSARTWSQGVWQTRGGSVGAPGSGGRRRKVLRVWLREDSRFISACETEWHASEQDCWLKIKERVGLKEVCVCVCVCVRVCIVVVHLYIEVCWRICFIVTSIRNKTPKLKDTILRHSYWVAWLPLAITVGQHNAKHSLRKDSKQMSFRKVTETLLEENRSREPWWCEWIRGRTAAVTLGLCLR